MISFGCLALSQLGSRAHAGMWLFMPFLLFTILYYFVSLSVNAFSRDFDLRDHQRAVRVLASGRVPEGRCLPAGVR